MFSRKVIKRISPTIIVSKGRITSYNVCYTKLLRNYRSTQIILDAAHSVIAKNTNRKEKNLWTDKESGQLITFFEGSDEQREAEFVAEQILETLQKNPGFRNNFV